jgi:PAS domain S-box-containing protein
VASDPDSAIPPSDWEDAILAQRKEIAMQEHALAEEVGRGRQADSGWHTGEWQFRHLLETLPAGAYTCDPEGLITYFNQHAVQLWGRAPKLNDGVDRFCGSFKLFATDGSPIAHDQCWMALALKMDREYNGHEIVIERPDGQRLTVLAYANPIRDESGQLLGAVNVLVDVSDRKRAEEALAHQARELARSNADLEQFAYVASHDLQEPLRMMASFAKLLEQRYKGQFDADADACIGYIVEGAIRMQGLINDLLTYSRVGRQGQPFASTDCRAVFEAACMNLRGAIEEAGATVTAGPLPVVMADSTQLVRLFQNLIGNAMKFRSDRPVRVDVGAKRQGSEWRFWVQDNGMGIEAPYLERIFLIFQRLHHRSEYPGTGIGLAIAKKIVESHGGRIWVESEPGTGSTFYFTLPT